MKLTNEEVTKLAVYVLAIADVTGDHTENITDGLSMTSITHRDKDDVDTRIRELMEDE